MSIKVRINDQGFYEGVDETTGDVVWTEKKKRVYKNGKIEVASSPGKGRRTRESAETHHYVKDGRGETLWVPKGTNPDQLPKTIYPYSQVTCDNICQLVTEGNTLNEIGRMKDMPPPYVIHKWRRKYPEFASELKKAVEARAMFYHDQVIETAKEAKRATVHADRLKVDAFKWAAQVGDPNNFGNKTKISGDSENPVAFLIDTGIRREEEVQSIPAPFTQIEEEME